MFHAEIVHSPAVIIVSVARRPTDSFDEVRSGAYSCAVVEAAVEGKSSKLDVAGVKSAATRGLRSRRPSGEGNAHVVQP
ncbi:MAG: hypothetical protein OXE79_07165 [Acidimicrobiaceae bacterium]|nr:hypothetical protein [Acidimicrobiaceae bacterium]MCY4175961.1 hypothetical protein [Acidimicrobiaceae bacterium]MCY4279863.1 hypothetical protein [Acidimicrobiaceae bacterium]MCY4293256.1 hypothetical protein [Acidimicrobiaceae bacterium]